jgi:DNA polymerase-1
MKRLVLVDGAGLIYRSHFAFIRNPLATTTGEVVSAAYGVAAALIKVLREHAPDYLAFVLDSKEPTFRHARYAEYKATRDRMPDDLVAQLPRVREVVEAMSIPILEVPGYEADDIMGTLARRAEAGGIEVLLVSGDKDLLQLVSEHVRVLAPGREGAAWALLDAAGVRERLGVPPERVVDLLALMGDSSDNVPGVRGVGEKTALRLLEEAGSLDALLADPGRAPGKKIQEALRDDREMALLSRELVSIAADIPIPVTIESLARRPLDRAAVRALFETLEFRRLLTLLEAEDAGGGAPAAERGPQAGGEPGGPAGHGASVDLPLFSLPAAPGAAAPRLALEDAARRPRTPGYAVVADPGALARLAAALRAAGRFALDTETTSEDPMQGALVGISVAHREGEAAYVPVGHASGPRIPLDAVREALAPVLADASLAKVGQNVKYDALVLANHGLPLRGMAFDTMLASFLLEPDRRQHGLDVLALEILGHHMIPIADLIGRGRETRTMAEVPIEDAAEYACEDADMTLRLANRFAPRLAEKGLARLFEEVEMPLIPVLERMERAGVFVDADRLRSLGAAFEKEMDALVREIHALAGVPFNVNSTRELAAVLFERLGLGPRRKTKTGYSTDQDVLEDLAAEHDLPRKVLEYRRLAKLRSTYVEALPRLVNPRTGALHTSFSQTVAATGRLSSSDPNLQNIPVRTALGREIRRAFVPRRAGWEMASLDYSQIELRILAHFTGDPALTAAFREGADIHRRTAARVLKMPEASVDDEARDRAKAVNFGIIYGMGAFGLASRLGIGRDEARAFIDDYFATYPAVKAWIDATIVEARAKGFVTTMAGRVRHIPELASANRGVQALGERLAVNSRIQGTAADLIKMAMIAIDAMIETERLECLMILQVHDELVFEGPPRALDAFRPRAADAMRAPAALSVPIEVHVGRGPNWADLS